MNYGQIHVPENAHDRNVSHISGILARRMGVPEEDTEQIEFAALYHDEGKSLIPPAILNKPGRLTPEEYSLVKTHAEIGGRMMADMVEAYRLAEVISRYHHEQWGGTGYEGLKGEAIPWQARIVGLADVVDALLSPRPYKEPWSFQETMEYVRQQRGKHFDPKVADALLECAGDVQALYCK